MILTPGMFVTHLIRENNNFIFELKPEMNWIIILKSILDGFNITMCAKIILSD